MGHEKMVHGFRRFPAAPVDALDLVPDMSIVVFLGQLGGGAVRRAPDLRAQLEFFFGWPAMGKRGDFEMELAEFLIDGQILKLSILTHLA